MLLTVNNVSGHVLNDFDSYYGFQPTPLVNAVGGQRKDPLPYPYSHVILAAAGPGATKILPVHPRDFHRKAVPSLPMMPGEEWNQMVQAGKVTYSVASEATFSDLDEAFISAV
jgi:hypothetical protein